MLRIFDAVYKNNYPAADVKERLVASACTWLANSDALPLKDLDAVGAKFENAVAGLSVAALASLREKSPRVSGAS